MLCLCCVVDVMLIMTELLQQQSAPPPYDPYIQSLRKRKHQLTSQQQYLKKTQKSRKQKQLQNKVRFASLQKPTFSYEGQVIEVKPMTEDLKVRLPRLRSEVTEAQIVKRVEEAKVVTVGGNRERRNRTVGAVEEDRREGRRRQMTEGKQVKEVKEVKVVKEVKERKQMKEGEVQMKRRFTLQKQLYSPDTDNSRLYSSVTTHPKLKGDVMNVFRKGYFDQASKKPKIYSIDAITNPYNLSQSQLKPKPQLNPSCSCSPQHQQQQSTSMHDAYKKMLFLQSRVNSIKYHLKFLKPLRFPTNKRELKQYQSNSKQNAKLLRQCQEIIQ